MFPMSAKYPSRTVARVTLLRNVEAVYESDAAKTVLLSEGSVIGNVEGHSQGLQLIERPEGLHLSFRACGWYEAWRGVPADAVKIEELTTHKLG